MDLFHTPRDQGNEKNKAGNRKMGFRFIPMICGCISFTSNQNVFHALIFDNL